jgi:hypothetical protein
MDAYQTYWFSLICIALGCLGMGAGFGYMFGWNGGWRNGFNSASEIWGDVMGSPLDESEPKETVH